MKCAWKKYNFIEAKNAEICYLWQVNETKCYHMRWIDMFANLVVMKINILATSGYQCINHLNITPWGNKKTQLTITGKLRKRKPLKSQQNQYRTSRNVRETKHIQANTKTKISKHKRKPERKPCKHTMKMVYWTKLGMYSNVGLKWMKRKKTNTKYKSGPSFAPTNTL